MGHKARVAVIAKCREPAIWIADRSSLLVRCGDSTPASKPAGASAIRRAWQNMTLRLGAPFYGTGTADAAPGTGTGTGVVVAYFNSHRPSIFRASPLRFT